MNRLFSGLFFFCILAGSLNADITLYSDSTPLIRCECGDETQNYSKVFLYSSPALIGHYSADIAQYWSVVNGIPQISIPVSFTVEGLTGGSHFWALRKGNGFNEKRFSFSYVYKEIEDEKGTRGSHSYNWEMHERSVDCTNHWFE